MAEYEGDAFVAAEVGEPVPAEDTLDSHDETFAVGRDGFEEGVGIGADVLVEDGLSSVIEDAEVHA